MKKSSGPIAEMSLAQPIVGQRGKETQAYGTLARYPLGLSDQARAAMVEGLNLLLADTISLRDMYKKHHWQVSGPTFYALHLLFDKHAGEQTEVVDTLKPPRGREEVPLETSRVGQRSSVTEGTNDLVVSEVVRLNELQLWFVSEHVVDTPLVHAGARGEHA